MKIGILTQPLLNNYGGLLQNYALQQVLFNMGHKVETIDWFPNEIVSLSSILWRWKKAALNLLRNDIEPSPYRLSDKEKAIISKNTITFIRRYLTLCSQQAHHYNDFINIDIKNKYDAYIVGSDQVWRPEYNPFQPVMFLDFLKRDNVKRIAYAASFGTSAWNFTPQMTEECARLAKRFDLITVRENSGVSLCREHLGVEATHVIDPTMLLNREDYVKLVMAENEPKSAGTLFHYILDPGEEKRGLIERLAADQGLQPFTIMPNCQAENRTKWDVKHRIEDCIFPSITSWLRGFMDAEMVVVDSFHGAVFSIIFNKPFWVIENGKRGNARFESLLGLYGLEDRMIDSTCKGLDMYKKIDWSHVNDIRRREVLRCKNLLYNALS